jgi:hypothetical protein
MPQGVLFQIGKTPFDVNLLLIYLGGAIFFCVVLKLSGLYWKRRLTQWAESQRLELLSYKRAWFFQGPSAWGRSRNQHVFRVVTKDRDGLTRYCWITFGTFWGFTWGEPLSAVEWDDADY